MILDDTPLITQFAANKVCDFVGAAYMVSPLVLNLVHICLCWFKLLVIVMGLI